MNALSSLTDLAREYYHLFLQGKIAFQIDHIEIGDGGHDPVTGDPLPLDTTASSLSSPVHSFPLSEIQFDSRFLPWTRLEIQWDPDGSTTTYSELGVFASVSWAEDPSLVSTTFLLSISHFSPITKGPTDGNTLHSFIKV